MKGTLLKGASRRMIVVKSRESKWFEEAQFILREDTAQSELSTLLEEANRIVEQSRIPRARRISHGKSIQFALGLLTGAAIESLGLIIYFLIR